VVTGGALGDNLSNKGRAYLDQAFKQRGIQVIDQARVLEVREGEVLTAQGVIPFDLCVWAASMKVSDLARQAGVQVNTVGQILTDAALRSHSHPDVFAVGDAAHMTEALVPTRMSCQLAQPQGAHTADNLARIVLGEIVQPFNFRYSLLCISLGRSDGLVHVVTPEDVPTERIFTGRVGAWIKGIVVWSTVFAMKMERWFPGSLPIPVYPQKKAAEARRPLEERTEGKST
jgi:NADH dehydrogenase FAD-containing subunit